MSDKIYAWVSVNEDGKEELIVAQIPNIEFPLSVVSHDREVVEMFTDEAKELAFKAKTKARFVEFSNKTILNEINPEEKNENPL